MTNLSKKTRWQLVLDALRAAGDDGVLTAELENAAVGGTAGTARVRELRGKGYMIEARPANGTSQFRYVLVSEPEPVLLTHPSEPIGHFGKITEDEGGLRIEVIPTEHFPTEYDPRLPYVQWKWRRQGVSMFAIVNEKELVVMKAWSGSWSWVVRSGSVDSHTYGNSATIEEAKRAAIEAAHA